MACTSEFMLLRWNPLLNTQHLACADDSRPLCHGPSKAWHEAGAILLGDNKVATGLTHLSRPKPLSLRKFDLPDEIVATPWHSVVGTNSRAIAGTAFHGLGVERELDSSQEPYRRESVVTQDRPLDVRDEGLLGLVANISPSPNYQVQRPAAAFSTRARQRSCALGARPPAAEHFMRPGPLQRRVRRHGPT